MVDHITISKALSERKDSTKSQYPTSLVLYNRRDLPLEGVHSMKIDGMWTLKHEFRSPKLYEFLIKTELKVDTDLDLNNFYNHINMCLNTVTRFWEDLLSIYLFIKVHSEFDNTSSHIVITLHILEIFIYTLPLDTHC